MEQQIPDAVAEDTLIAEDKLAEAILQENEALPVSGVAEVAPAESEPVPTETAQEESAPVETTQPDSEADVEDVQEIVPTTEVATVAEPLSYTIKEGDTLIAISLRQYGSDMKVQEICSLNQIDNPDDIKVGQKILLP